VKKTILGIVIGLLIGSTVTWIFSRHSEKDEHAEEHKEESRVHRGTNGEVLVKVDKATQERIGLKSETLQPAELPMEVKGYGRVLDPAPLSMLLAEQISTEASLEVSTKEYQRLKGLYAQEQNVSTRALEAAEATMKKDRALVEAAKTKLALTLGQAAMSQSNLQEFIRSFTSLQAALVRLDLPLGESLKVTPQGGRIAALSAEEQPIPAEFLGRAPAADPQTQGQGFLFVLRTNALPPGAAVIGWLQMPGETQRGIIVPRAAIVRHEGELFVYVQTDEETFRRQEIHAERPVENGWFVRAGLAPTDKVIVAGAQQLLSEELKAIAGAEEE
jgi:hypothetical protein